MTLRAPSPAAGTPLRRPQSVRRTLSMDVRYPHGRFGPLEIVGRGRDIWTADPAQPPKTLSFDEIAATLSAGLEIEAIAAAPPLPGLDTLVGGHAVFGWRNRLRAAIGTGDHGGRLAAALLDDMVPIGIISSWVWLKWPSEGASPYDEHPQEGACIGYARGSSALRPDYDQWDTIAAPALLRADDPEAFHPFLPDSGDDAPAMRRVRRIDVWHEGGTIHADTMFQDSARLPGGARAGVHQYALSAQIDPDTMTVRSLDATPHILPHAECFDAPGSVAKLVGTPLASLRRDTLDRLRGPLGCTHLNDAVRSLAEIAALLPS